MSQEIESSVQRPPYFVFGEQLRALRELSDLDREQLSEKVNYKPAKRIAELESGEFAPPKNPSFYRKLLQNVGVSDFAMHFLLGAAGAHPRLMEQVLPDRYKARKIPGIRGLVLEDPTNSLPNEVWQNYHKAHMRSRRKFLKTHDKTETSVSIFMSDQGSMVLSSGKGS